jgi:transglutaminase-like putative cysteine protease
VNKPDRIGDVQLPASTQWYDQDYRLVLTQSELPGLGELTLRRTTREAALAPNGRLQDLGSQSIGLNRTIPNIHSRQRVVYRVTFTRDFEPSETEERLKELREKSFASGDGRQEVIAAQGRSIELQITAQRAPSGNAANLLVPTEFLESNYFINSSDAKVRDLAEQAVGTIGDPWRKAQAIERWVRRNMQAVAFTEAMATADHVARTLRGDCTEFAMLTAAMCRAQNIRHRTDLLS